MAEKTNFDSFWENYPNKKGKGAARAAYEKQEKAHGDERDFYETVISAVAVQKRWRAQQKSAGVFIPEWKMPTTWLNQECWCDEVQIEPREKVTIGAQCSKPNCPHPVHGPRYNLCEEHEALNGEPLLLAEVREKYKELVKICHTTTEWRAKFKELAAYGLGGKSGKAMSR